MSQSIRSPYKGVNIFDIGPWSNLHKDFCQVYKECFGGPPYHEEYTDEWIIENVYNKHLDHGCVSVALYNGMLIGLSCAERMLDYTNSSPYRYLMELERSGDLVFPLDTSCYISELAVVEPMRRKGIGTDLLRVLCNWGLSKGLTHYTARTAAQGSHSLGIFQRHLHATILDGEQEVDGVVGEVPTQSKKRVYVWGKLDSYL